MKNNQFFHVPKKRFGQNFLNVPYYAEKIAASIDYNGYGDILEIGPGSGALSVFLIKRFPCFHCIEMDNDLIPVLKQKLGEGNYQIHSGNVMDFDLYSLGYPLHIAGNLPYNMAAVIIKKSLLSAPHVKSITFMVQREVAERIVSGPHSKKIGFISVFCQFFGVPRILFHVPPGAFIPKPKVDSSVFQITIQDGIEQILDKTRWNDFFSFVSTGFSKRRKMLSTALSWNSGNREQIVSLMQKNSISITARAEDLSVQEWLKLYLAAGISWHKTSQ